VTDNEAPIAIIDYEIGNLQSIRNAFKLVDEDPLVIADPDELTDIRGVVVPGVGAFADGIANLRKKGFVDPLERLVLKEKVPYLGVCLGMQFLANASTERGRHKGLGWIPGTVRRIRPEEDGYQIPHIGWNEARVTDSNQPLYTDLGDEPVFYFVHSYHFDVDDDHADCVTATGWHGATLTASVRRDNIFGVQFHPEKSQGAGLKLVENFVDITREGIDG
jgi:glutamine amidotransferase